MLRMPPNLIHNLLDSYKSAAWTNCLPWKYSYHQYVWNRDWRIEITDKYTIWQMTEKRADCYDAEYWFPVQDIFRKYQGNYTENTNKKMS